MAEKTAIKASQYLSSIDKESCQVSFCEQFDEKSHIWDYSMHAHDCIEFIYFLEGQADIATEEEDMALSLFEIVVYPKNVKHQEFLDTRYRQSIICIHLQCETALQMERFFKLKDENGKLRWVFRRICEAYHDESGGQKQVLNDLVVLLIDMLIYFSGKLQSEKSNLPEKCLQYMQEHYAEDISMETLAARLYVSTSYLNRIFKKQYKTTPIKYLNLYRVEIAGELLVQTDYKISVIAGMAGFEDARNFSKVFKKITGLTPGEYRSRPGKTREVAVEA